MNEIVKISPNNSLVKVSNLISLTNKLHNEINNNEIVLYNSSAFNLQQKIEIAFLNFIRKNIWFFLPEIIYQLKSNKLTLNPYPADFIQIIRKNDLNYEYPQSFFRTRIKPNQIDKEPHHSWPIDYIDNNFKKTAFENINCFIVGKIITEYADTSIGTALGLKYKWTTNNE